MGTKEDPPYLHRAASAPPLVIRLTVSHYATSLTKPVASILQDVYTEQCATAERRSRSCIPGQTRARDKGKVSFILCLDTGCFAGLMVTGCDSTDSALEHNRFSDRFTFPRGPDRSI